MKSSSDISDCLVLGAALPTDAVVLAVVAAMLLVVAVFDSLRMFGSYSRMMSGLTKPRYVWLTGFLVFSDRFFTEDGAKNRRLFLFQFCRAILALIGAVGLAWAAGALR